MLDVHFDKIESSLLIPELNSLIGKARTDKMIEREYFLNILYLFKAHKYDDNVNKAHYSTVAKEMIFFEESDLVSRKTEVKKYTIDNRVVGNRAEKYISGEQFSSLSQLVRQSRSFYWGSDW